MRSVLVVVTLIVIAGCGSIRPRQAAPDAAPEDARPAVAGQAGPAAVISGSAAASAPAAPAVPGGAAEVDPGSLPGAAAEREDDGVDFAAQVLPILERCRPCHFEGGKMYEDLPFDSPDTIRTLGERLFTRIKDAGDQKVIREFLAADPEAGTDGEGAGGG